ncbi:YozQ family protein [Schinkia sp. CFF1]
MEKNDSSKLAEKNYQPGDYTNKNELASGLATTHEQATDAYTEGTLNAKIDNVNGQDVEIPKKGNEG